MRRTLAVPAVAAALALSLAACGGDSDSSDAETTGATGFDVSSVKENRDVSSLVPTMAALRCFMSAFVKPITIIKPFGNNNLCCPASKL